jgi:hypothetical protein
VSDQDFFFEEDEKAETAKTAPAKKASKQAPAAMESDSSFAGMAQSVSMAVTVLVAVIALLIGVIVGILLPIGSGAPQPATSTTGVTGGTGGTGSAPQLTEEQLKQGQLPPGHPSIGGSTTTTGTSK